MKVLNLYAGIGGNRKLWPKECYVVAVENNPKIADEYLDRFPQDEVIQADAHQYLLEHFNHYDFVWSSPPCQTHSQTNNFLKGQGIIRYPDMKLYEEIILLQTHCRAKWVVENVKSYYAPLIKPQQAGRHYFWANFTIPDFKTKTEVGTMNRAASILRQKKATRTQIERNCVDPGLGLHVFDCAFKGKQTILWTERRLKGETRK